jgi:hypothetical protein
MKIIFLDIDGVMCTSQCYGVGKDNKWDSYMFDHKCVAVLNFILQETGAEIIMSSDWRHTYTLQEMREIFCHNNVIRGPIGYTSRSNTYTADNLAGGRADEIQHWIKTHAWKDDTRWVAVDDLNMDEKLFPNFVLCPREQEGIKRLGVKEKILETLNGKN